jgi:hypothetical protein
MISLLVEHNVLSPLRGCTLYQPPFCFCQLRVKLFHLSELNFLRFLTLKEFMFSLGLKNSSYSRFFHNYIN